jgi:hypothetical protein
MASNALPTGAPEQAFDRILHLLEGPHLICLTLSPETPHSFASSTRLMGFSASCCDSAPDE